MAKYEVGQELIVKTTYRSTRGDLPVTVVKVGRKLVTVASSGGSEMVFRMDTGVENDGYGGRRIYTPEALAEEEREGRMETALRALGLEMTGALRRDLSAEDLDQMLAIVKAAGIRSGRISAA